MARQMYAQAGIQPFRTINWRSPPMTMEKGSGWSQNGIRTVATQDKYSFFSSAIGSLLRPRNTKTTTTATTLQRPPMKLIRKIEPGKCIPHGKPSTAKLFDLGRKLVVKRAPLMPGLSVAIAKPFQRPMVKKRRAYGKNADLELKHSSLGQKRRMNGMERLLSRAGKGIHFKPLGGPQRSSTSDTDHTESDDEDDKAKEPDRPIEPLMVWKSPHNGGEPKGLPSQSVREKRTDEFGVDTDVTVLKPASLTLYSKNDVYVPTVLAKWLRPHQREGVQFVYECVMGLKDYKGKGVILADGTSTNAAFLAQILTNDHRYGKAYNHCGQLCQNA
jgi:hypothetical protein